MYFVIFYFIIYDIIIEWFCRRPWHEEEKEEEEEECTWPGYSGNDFYCLSKIFKSEDTECGASDKTTFESLFLEDFYKNL